MVDRVAQTVAAWCWSRKWRRYFTRTPTGTAPGRSALDAVQECRERCWEKNWIVDLDIKAFFDSVPWDLMLKAVKRHPEPEMGPAVCEAWLKAPMLMPDGTLAERTKGTPQGGLCAAKHNEPWGVPVSVSFSAPSSVRMPAFRNAFTSARTRLSPIRRRTRSSFRGLQDIVEQNRECASTIHS